MLFNNLAFLPSLAVFKRGLTFSQKVSGNPAAANIFTPKGKNCSTVSEVNDRFATNQNDISVKLQSLYESNTAFVRCFENWMMLQDVWAEIRL